MQIELTKEQLPKKLNVAQLRVGLSQSFPGVKVDDSQLEGRTYTPRDKEGNELDVVFVPPKLIMDIPDDVNKAAMIQWVKTQIYNKTDKEEQTEREANKLFDLLMLSPKFREFIGK